MITRARKCVNVCIKMVLVKVNVPANPLSLSLYIVFCLIITSVSVKMYSF